MTASVFTDAKRICASWSHVCPVLVTDAPLYLVESLQILPFAGAWPPVGAGAGVGGSMGRAH